MSDLKTGVILSHRYRILRQLGSGGFGETFLAEDLQRPHQPKCVVKQLHPFSQESFVLETARRLFVQEAEVLEQLGKHDRIPTLLAHFEEDGQFYLVQDYIDGEDLDGKLSGFTEVDTIGLIQEVLEILQYVHSRNVIHRDIKPANLIRRREDGKLVAIDFGAVKQLRGQSTTATGQKSLTVAIGTPGYMPMEQSSGKPRPNSDIYAVGMLAIHALTGMDPDTFPEDPQSGELIWQDRVQVSPAFASILSKMVRYDYRQRYQTTTDVLYDLTSLTRITSPSTEIHPSFPSKPDIRGTIKPESTEIIGSKFPEKEKISPQHIQLGVPTLVLVGGLVLAILGGTGLWRTVMENRTTPSDPPPPVASNNQSSPVPFPSSPSQSASDYFDSGLKKYDQGDFQGAIGDYSEAIRLNPGYADAYYNRGIAKNDLNDYQGAIADYNQAIGLKSDYTNAYLNRGNAKDSLGDSQGAIADYNQALGLQPDYAIAYYNRGISNNKLGNRQNAISDYNEAIRIDPNYTNAYYNRGIVKDELKDYQGAISDYSEAIRIDPNYTNAYYNRGIVKDALGDSQGAIADYTETLRIDPEYANAYYNRGNTYELLNENSKAIADFKNAAVLYKKNEDTTWFNKANQRIRTLEQSISQGEQTGTSSFSSGVATIYDPPSNIRVRPNGRILCSVPTKGALISIQGQEGKWYRTDHCGSPGFIHRSQVRF